MARKKEQPISLKFLFFITVFIIVILVYATTPNDIKKIQKAQTFEEMLEYTNFPQNGNLEENIQQINKNDDIKQEKEVYNNNRNFNVYNYNQNTEIQTHQKPDYKNDANFLVLLDKLRENPAKSSTSVEIIVQELLKYKGFPQYTIRTITEEQTNQAQKTQGSYIAAYFNMENGNMYVNKSALYQTDIEHVIAIVAHELDHFEKNAQICKSMGINNYVKLLNDNKMRNINVSFWSKAQEYADISDFDAVNYQQALERYLNQGSIDVTSSYSDLYRLSEHIRNPMEISAYDVSDFIFNYYQIPNEDGPLKRLVKKFNALDWEIYNLIANNNILKNERIALFDYYFSQAITSLYPQYKKYYDNCIESGDMTEFWLAFEKDHESFYNKNKQLDEKTYLSIMQLISKTEEIAKLGINNEIVLVALKNKVNTLRSHIVFPNAVKYIASAAEAYLKYSKRNGSQNPKDELKMIFTLLCIENNLYTTTEEAIPSLYYIKMPSVIEELYPTTKRNQKFNYIFNNQGFKDEFAKRKSTNPELTEHQLITDLLYENRLNKQI